MEPRRHHFRALGGSRGRFGAPRAPWQIQGAILFNFLAALGWSPRGAQESPREPQRPQNDAQSDLREPKSLPKGVPERPEEAQKREKLLFIILIPLCSGIGGYSTPRPPGTSTLGPWASKKRKNTQKRQSREKTKQKYRQTRATWDKKARWRAKKMQKVRKSA